VYVEQYKHEITKINECRHERISGIDSRLNILTAPKARERLIKTRESEQRRFDKKIQSVCSKISDWIDSPNQFSFELETV